MAKKKARKKSKDAVKPLPSSAVAGAKETLRAIRDEAKDCLGSGNRRPLQTILALVETGLCQLSGKPIA